MGRKNSYTKEEENESIVTIWQTSSQFFKTTFLLCCFSILFFIGILVETTTTTVQSNDPSDESNVPILVETTPTITVQSNDPSDESTVEEQGLSELENSKNNIESAEQEWDTTSSKESLEMEFDWINKRLIGPPVSGIDYGVTSVDYERWYTAEDIEASINFMDQHAGVILSFAKSQLETRGREAKMQCDNVATKCNEQFVNELKRERCKANGVLGGGGWCLVADTQRGHALLNTGYTIPYHHVEGSKRVIEELSNFIVAEKISSINDFGAGVGQYKPEILQRHPNMVYEAYDGAGNVNEYTNGNVDFFDLTLPLGLPKSEWVVSFEVGEHVPSMFEGMVIRNLHRHNTKGIILSWGVLGQGGHSHVNNHSNEYIIEIFERLGYTYLQDWTARFRQSKGIYSYFKESIMVFKRNQ